MIYLRISSPSASSACQCIFVIEALLLFPHKNPAPSPETRKYILPATTAIQPQLNYFSPAEYRNCSTFLPYIALQYYDMISAKPLMLFGSIDMIRLRPWRWHRQSQYLVAMNSWH